MGLEGGMYSVLCLILSTVIFALECYAFLGRKMTQMLRNCCSVCACMKCLCHLTSRYQIITWGVPPLLKSKGLGI